MMRNNETQVGTWGWSTVAAIAILLSLTIFGCAPEDEMDDWLPPCPTVSHFAAMVTTDGAEPDLLTLDAQLGEGEWSECHHYEGEPVWRCGLKMIGEVTVRARHEDGREVRDTRTYTGDHCGPTYPPVEVNLVLPAL